MTSSRPRIGIDVHTLEGLHQGSRTHCLELFSRIPAQMPEADFVFFADHTRWDAAAAALFAGPNVRTVHMPHKNPFYRLGLQLPALARREKLNLLHTQYIAPLRLPCASAVTVHDILFEDFPEFFTRFFRFRSRLLVRSSARRAELVFSVSEFSKQDLHRRYGIPVDKIIVLRNAADLNRFHPTASPDDASPADAETLRAWGLAPGQYLLTVGRLEPRKNHKRLLEAFARLPSPRPKLAIVGQRDFGYEGILTLQQTLGLQQDVLFLENVADAALPMLYRHARLFVYPTLAEGFGMPVLEAMASGVPVLTSATTALPEVTGDAALLTDPYSVDALASAMQRLLADPSEAERLRAAGLARARTFSWDQAAAELARSYRAFLRR